MAFFRIRTRSPRNPRRERGQASIMIAVMMLTFLFFFAFVVNTGMLVNAKISLQTAADMAAYAGAAVQARQLNQISFLNYEMRRQYKKFLYRYYVLGNMAQASFPRSGGGGATRTPAPWSPTESPRIDYNVPVVCIIVKNLDNYCQVSNLPAINIPRASPFDSITNTLRKYLEEMESLRQASCDSIGATNAMLLRLWLWNTDPSLNALTSVVTDPKQRESLEFIKALGSGLGLIPRELILWRRAKTLEEYLNTPPNLGVSLGQVQSWNSGGDDGPPQERTIQAYLSAFYSLGNHTFPGGSITLDELIPPEIARLEDVKTQFTAYSMMLEKRDPTGPGSNRKDCIPRFQPETLQKPLAVGVYKDPRILTYYAVRVRAKAKILFNPFGQELDLKAYAAAQPFGSRIGPASNGEDWVRPDGAPPAGMDVNPSGFSYIQKIPNLPIRPGDGTGKGQGWDTLETLGSLFNVFRNEDGALSPSITEAELQKAYEAAMAPNPFESQIYNIPNDESTGEGGDPFVRHFDSNHVLAFWAPVFPASKKSTMASELQTLVDSLIDKNNTSTQFTAEALKLQLATYMGLLESAGGEAGEGFNIVRMTDPFYHRSSGGFARINLPDWIMPKNPADFRSSWAPQAQQSRGRVGYSVKWVSFKGLTDTRTPANWRSSEIWSNSINEGEALDDIFFIQH